MEEKSRHREINCTEWIMKYFALNVVRYCCVDVEVPFDHDNLILQVITS